MEIKITGFKEVDKALGDLEAKLSKKIIRQSMREGLRITLEKVRQLAPVGEDRMIRGKAHAAGTLRKMLKIRAAKSKKRGTITLRVMTGKKDYQGEAFYASMVEWGTVKQPAQGFMRRGLEMTGTQVISKTNERIRDGINQVVRWWKRV